MLFSNAHGFLDVWIFDSWYTYHYVSKKKKYLLVTAVYCSLVLMYVIPHLLPLKNPNFDELYVFWLAI